jgi:hypothetical protein
MMAEWGIVHWASPEELHRGPMSEAEARQWVVEWEHDGGREGSFLVVRREVGPWLKEATVAAVGRVQAVRGQVP